MLAHLLIAAAMAAAPPPSGLDIKVRADDPLKAVIVLTNNSGKACQVANTTLGTVALTRVEQAGKAITPIPIDVGFPERTDSLLSQRLQTLEPGKTAELKLPVVKAGPTGQALEMVTWSDAGAFGSLFPIVAGKPLSIDLAYNVPVQGDDKTPLCEPGFSTGSVSGGAGSSQRPKWMIWAAIGAGILLLVLLAVFLLTRRKKPAAAAVLFLLAGTGMLIHAKPALADYDVDPSLQTDFNDCMNTFRQPGHDPAGLLPGLDGSYHVHVVPGHGDVDHADVLRDQAFIFWDPTDRHAYFGGGGNADPCTTLYHELSHASQGQQGTWSMDPCATTDARGRTLPRTEVVATQAQNLLRVALGMPARTHYGDIPLPPDCKPPERPHRCEGAGCGDSNGDPHLLTFDHKRYDFQAVGEFVLTRSAEYQIQVRQQPWPSSRSVSVNTAVAMGMGSDKIEIRMTPAGMVLLVGGQPKQLTSATFGTAEVKTAGGEAEVDFTKGPKVFVRPIGIWGLDVSVEPDLGHVGKLEGLLGNFDGDSSNDVTPRTSAFQGGQPIKDATFEALYPSYADSWRISAKESLFTYDPGTSTDTYTDRKFPEKRPDPESLPGRDAAERLCKQQGVTDPDVLTACIIDVALTGQADFARGAAIGQLLANGGDWGGIPFTMRLSKVDDKATVQFDGVQGQQVYVDVLTTLPSSCGTVNLIAPDGTGIRTGCMINGIGELDATLLPATGKYTISVTASGGVGEAYLRVVTFKDQVSGVTPDSAPTLVHLDKPGMVGKFTFPGRKDQKVYVAFTDASLPSECGLVNLLKPDGTGIRSGCIINGEGELDGTILPEDGPYTIVVDPGGRTTGDVYLRLISVTDQHGTIAANGPAVIAKIGQPGAVASFTFSGTAGQRVFVDATAGTLPSACGLFSMTDPDGGPTVGGCLINGAGGLAETDGYVLLKTGTYTLIVDPPGNGTGQVALKLRG